MLLDMDTPSPTPLPSRPLDLSTIRDPVIRAQAERVARTCEQLAREKALLIALVRAQEEA